MILEDIPLYKFIMKHKVFLQVVEGICIITKISMLWISLHRSNVLQEEISENCGWGKEDYECYCQKDSALTLKHELENREIKINLTDVPN